MVVKDWITDAGLRAVILFVRDSHHCGYVAVPEGHALYGIGYSDRTPGLNIEEGTEVGKRSPISVFCAAFQDEPLQGVSPDVYFDVHGSISFSGGGDKYPVESTGLWWFGFDCHHAGDASLDPAMPSFDGDVFRDEAYVTGECELLAKQLIEVIGVFDGVES